MVGIRKKLLTNSGGMRVILVLLYVLATFGIPLSHTCQVADGDIRQHSECADHGHEDGKLSESGFAFSQSNCDNENQPHSTYCAACLYLQTSKTFKLYPNTSLRPTQTVVRTQVLPQLSFVIQIEWFCSAQLRAPPSIAS